MLGENGCSRSEGEAREDNFAALGGETKIGCPDGQRLLDGAFGAFSGWQWVTLQESGVEKIVVCEVKGWRRPVCSCLEERRRNVVENLQHC